MNINNHLVEIWAPFRVVFIGRRLLDKRNALAPEPARIWEISTHGRVRYWHTYNDRIVIVKPSATGGHPNKRYLALSSNKAGKYIHRLVATAFIPNPSGCSTVDHIDGNTRNNHVSNLRWCTNQENLQAAAAARRIIKNYAHGQTL